MKHPMKTWKELLLAMGAACAATAGAQTTVIHAGHLIAEAGKPVLAAQSIVIEGGKVVAIQPGFVPGGTVIDLKDAWVMPGLIDMHTHVSGELNLEEPVGGQIAMAYMGRPAEQVLAALPRVKTMLMNGFTTVRNLGDPIGITYALRDAINKGVVPGPRMFVTEAQIAIEGGDYDPSSWGVRAELEKYVASRGACSGVTQCVKAVRMEVWRGADVVKMRQSGIAAMDPKIGMAESPEEVRAIIDTAHQLNKKVAVHVVGSPPYMHLVIAAGVDSLEHGPVDDASIALMKKHGTAFTPTLLAGKLIDYRFKEAQEGVGKAYRAGVMITFGSDLGIMGPKRSHEEFALLVEAGLPPEQALRAATMNAATALGLGDTLGSIAPGKTADLIAMKMDPLAHIDQLGDGDAVAFVMKDGVVYKGGK